MQISAQTFTFIKSYNSQTQKLKTIKNTLMKHN